MQVLLMGRSGLHKTTFPVFVATTGRTGSSAFMKMLELLGLRLGDTFSHGGKDFGENVGLSFFNQSVLDGDRDTYDPKFMLSRDVDLEKPFAEAFPNWRDMMTRRVPFGFKDPRLCNLWEVYDRYMPYATWVVLERDTEDLLKPPTPFTKELLRYRQSRLYEITQTVTHSILIDYHDVAECLQELACNLCLKNDNESIREALKLWKPNQ